MEPNGYNVADGTEGLTEKDVERLVASTGTKCALVTPDEEIIETYKSLREAGRVNNANSECIAKVCRGISYQTKGKIFRYLNDNNEIIEVDHLQNTRYVPICSINPLTLEKKYYESIKEGAADIGVTPNQISKCIQGLTSNKFIKGLIWRKYINNKIVENNLLIDDLINQYKQKFIFYNQEYKTLHQWCQDLNLPYDAVRYQMRKYNKSFEEAIKIGKNK